MRTSSDENIDFAFNYEAISFEKSATGPSSSDYFQEKREEHETLGSMILEKIRGLREIPQPIIGLNEFEKNQTSATMGNSLPIGKGNRLQLEITKAADHFIDCQKRAVKYKKEIMSVAERILSFLQKNGIEAKVTISLYSDPEYNNWIEPKIQIEIARQELQRTYEIFDSLLTNSFSGISEKTLRKIFVTIDSRQ